MATFDTAALRRLVERAQRDADAGLEWGGVEGCSLAIAYRGETVLEAALWRL